MSSKSIMELDEFVKEETCTDQICSIVLNLRPVWSRENVTIQRLPGGIFNTVSMVKSSEHPDDLLAVKVFTGASSLLVDHQSEYALLRVLSAESEFIQLFCKFRNGYVYKYFPGRLLNRTDLDDEAILRGMFGQLHTLHHLPIAASLDEQIHEYDANADLLAKFMDILAKDDAKELDDNPNMSGAGLSRQVVLDIGKETLAEYRALKEHLPYALCHNDARPGNFIIDENTGCVRAIDWDCMSFAPEICDIATMFNRDRLFNIQDSADEARMDTWLRLYLETHPKYMDSPIQPVTFIQWKRNFLWASHIMEKWLVVDFAAYHVAFGKFINVDFLGACVDVRNRSELYKAKLQTMGTGN